MMSMVRAGILAVSGSLGASLVAKATVVAMLGLAGAWLARRSRAALRHALLAATFGVLLALPIASLVAPPVRISVAAAAPQQMAALAPAVAIAPASGPVRPSTGVAPGAPRSGGLPLSAVLLTVWIAGMALSLLPVAMGLWQVRSMRRTALPWRQGQPLAARLALDAGVRRRVEVLLHGALPGPMTCGVVHPAIVLPEDAPTWRGEDLTRAMVHELEHVKRGDWVGHGIARVVCALYWFHPLVWMAWRRLALEAERSCDDAVLGRTEATAYADQLVGLAHRLSTAAKAPLLAMANRADLAARVRAALDGRQRRGRAGAWAIALACGCAAALVLTMSPLRIVAAEQSSKVENAGTIPALANRTQPASAVGAASQYGRAAHRLVTVPILGMAAVAQSDVPSATAPHFLASTYLVITDVTVSDNSGRSIDRLSPQDFAVTEDGAAQDIAIFQFEKLASATNGVQDYYILGYYTTKPYLDATYRTIRVTLNGETPAKLRYRAGYYAGAITASGLAYAVIESTDPGAPVPIYKKEAEYSEEARKAKYQGTVALEVDVDPSGQVGDTRVIRSLGLGLDEKATEAVEQWQFKPGMKDGKAISVKVLVDVNFRLL
jgi:TonB family protein